MSVLDLMAGGNRVGLAKAIQKAIQDYTKLRPMAPDEVIATMAFCTGSAIGIQPNDGDKRRLAELAVKFLDDGDAVASGKRHESTGLIDIRGMTPN